MSVLVTKNNSFFYTCKENYFLNILPTDPEVKDKEGYKALANIAKTYFSEGLNESIEQYLNEGRYMIQVWSAYLTLEYGQPNEELKMKCHEIILKFTVSSVQQPT